MNKTYLIVILLTVFFSACAQLLLKIGVTNKNVEFNSLSNIIKLLLSPATLGGLVIYGTSVVVWMWVLSKVELSIAYPFVGLSFIFTFIFGCFFLNETLNIYKVMGTLLIVIGCFFVSKA